MPGGRRRPRRPWTSSHPGLGLGAHNREVIRFYGVCAFPVAPRTGKGYKKKTIIINLLSISRPGRKQLLNMGKLRPNCFFSSSFIFK